jgi:hypothetical protein
VRVAEPSTAEHVAAREYLAEFSAACEQAITRVGARGFDLRINSVPVRLRFAGPALVPLLTPALSHLHVPTNGTPPALTVALWDGESTGVMPPRFPWGGEDIRARGEIRGYNEAGVRTVFHGGIAPPAEDFTAVTMFDERTRVARFFVTAPARVPWYERAAPLRTAFHWGLGAPGHPLVHAGAVGAHGRAVLLAGPGGSGKSTTAVAALLAGLDYLGDDYVLVDLAPNRPVAHSLYATAKLAPEARILLPEIKAPGNASSRQDGEKDVLDVRRVRPEGIITSLPIAAIVLPHVHPGGPTELGPATAGTALRALAPSTIFQAPGAGRESLRPLSALVRRLPAYTLALGGPPAAGVAALSRLLEDPRL